MKKRLNFLFIALMVAAVNFSCTNPVEENESEAYLAISTEEGTERTVMPSVSKDDLFYELWGNGEKLSTWTSYQNMINDTSVKVTPGEWTFTLKAFHTSTNTQIFHGDITTDIKVGTTKLSFMLKEVPGTGSIEFTFYFPKQIDALQTVRATLQESPHQNTVYYGTAETSTQDIIENSLTENHVRYHSVSYTKDSVTSGYKILTFEVYSDGILKNTWSTTIKVSPGYTTTGTYTLKNVNYGTCEEYSISSSEIYSVMYETSASDLFLTITDSSPDLYTLKNAIEQYPSRRIYLDLTNCTELSEIYSYAFSHLYQALKEIILPSSVLRIEDYAFYECTGLRSVSIPSAVQSLGEYAFYDCMALTSVTLPQSITDIGSYAFDGCSSLTYINIPSSVTQIRDYTFYECTSLSSIYIPGTVQNIGNSAFFDCSALGTVNLSSGLQTIGEDAFYSCTSLSSITIPSSVTSIGSLAFYNCTALEILNLTAGVQSIGDSAFYGCTSLSSLTIPSSVNSIGSYAFYDCSALTSIVIPESVTSVGYYAFYHNDTNHQVAISIPVSLINFSYSNSRTIFNANANFTLKLTGSETSLNNNALANMHGLRSVDLSSSSIQTIGQEAFFSCENLRTVTLPQTLTRISANAFNSTNLNSTSFTGSVSYTNLYLYSYTEWWQEGNTEDENYEYRLEASTVTENSSTMASYLRNTYSGYWWYFN